MALTSDTSLYIMAKSSLQISGGEKGGVNFITYVKMTCLPRRVWLSSGGLGPLSQLWPRDHTHRYPCVIFWISMHTKIESQKLTRNDEYLHSPVDFCDARPTVKEDWIRIHGSDRSWHTSFNEFSRSFKVHFQEVFKDFFGSLKHPFAKKKSTMDFSNKT